MDLGLRNKVIVVTGGTEGIGGAISEVCATEGAIVVVVTRATAAVTAFEQKSREQGWRTHVVLRELGSPDSCRGAIDEVLLASGGRIDGLVNNAGVNDGVGLEHGDPERFLASVERNLGHYYHMTYYALPALKAARGAIVNISSKVALTGQGGTSGYAAAKAAQLGLTREWAAELLPYGVRVNAILPAEVMTPLYQSWLSTMADPESRLRQITSAIPLGQRMTSPQEIAATAAFLLSERASHTTGQFLHVDGGYVHLDRALTTPRQG